MPIKTKPLPDMTTLRAEFDCFADGSIFWRNRGGLPAGTSSERGYRYLYFKGEKYFVHRIIWKWHTGKEPEIIDHVNHDTADNRISNLRNVSLQQNNRYSRRAHGKSAFRGVYAAKCGKWGARIKVDGKTRHLGTFENEPDAARAYDAAAHSLHGKFAVSNARLGIFERFRKEAL